jgi:amino acid adenylation domain-containing protein
MVGHHLVTHLMHMSAQELTRTAFLWAGGSLTFARLRDRMLRMAAWLGEKAQVAPGDRVATCLPKSPEAVIAMYGIFAAGATYAPLQFLGPPERLNEILRSLRARLLLSAAPMSPRFAPENASVLREIGLREDGSGLDDWLQDVAPRAAPFEVAPDDLAWLIFTSGSTGQPKGVMLSHRNLTAHIEGMKRRDRMSPTDLRISHSPLHYVSAFDLLFPLVCGVRTFLLSERDAMISERLAEVMERQQATILSMSATALRFLLERGHLERRALGQLRRISFYGEAMPIPALRRVMEALPRVEFVNHYGATEMYNIANFIVPRPLPDDMLRLPLGWPVDYCEVSLRDDEGRAVAQGEVGEICVVSPGVTLGYWSDPQLTASTRIAGIPCSHRTGDFAFADDGGLLHPIGRTDQLVKVRGQRLDLGEVEAVLRMHSRVHDSFAVAAGGPDLEVRAVVQGEESPALRAELNQLCRQHLPSHGRPVRITILARFPLLATGKIDRLALRGIAAP